MRLSNRCASRIASISRTVAEFEAEHVVEEDLAVPIGVGEAVGCEGSQLLAGRRAVSRCERIEISMEMAAHAVGADHHDGPHRIPGRLHDDGLRRLDIPWPRRRSRALIFSLSPTAFSTWRPVAVERGDELSVGKWHGPARLAATMRPWRSARRAALLLVQSPEKKSRHSALDRIRDRCSKHAWRSSI